MTVLPATDLFPRCDPGCATWNDVGEDCDCGLAALRERSRGLEEALERIGNPAVPRHESREWYLGTLQRAVMVAREALSAGRGSEERTDG